MKHSFTQPPPLEDNFNSFALPAMRRIAEGLKERHPEAVDIWPSVIRFKARCWGWISATSITVMTSCGFEHGLRVGALGLRRRLGALHVPGFGV